MNERTLTRIGGGMLIVGAILAGIGNALHPRLALIPDLDTKIRAIAGNGLWEGLHVALFVAVLLLTGGLVALSRTISGEPAASWARMGMIAVVVSAPVYFVVGGVEQARQAMAMGWITGPADPGILAVNRLLETVVYNTFFMWVALFFGAAFICYGLAMRRGGAYPAWLGWIALIAGIVSAWVGIHHLYAGPTFEITVVLFAILSILLTLWMLVVGVLMWRRASA